MITGASQESLLLCPDVACLSLPVQLQFMRAARTDKGVSAVGQVVSFKMRGADRPGMLADVQSHLPAQIKLFGFMRVTNSFDARSSLQDGVLSGVCVRARQCIRSQRLGSFVTAGDRGSPPPAWHVGRLVLCRCCTSGQAWCRPWSGLPPPAHEQVQSGCCACMPAGRTATGGATNTSCLPGCSTGRWGAAG